MCISTVKTAYLISNLPKTIFFCFLDKPEDEGTFQRNVSDSVIYLLADIGWVSENKNSNNHPVPESPTIDIKLEALLPS